MEHVARARRLGDAIRAAREARGLSMRQLGKLSGVTFSFIGKIERGQVATMSPDNLAALARALEVPPEDLFALSGYSIPERLPTFGPYLRTRYGELPEQAIDQLNEYFQLLRAKYQGSGAGVDDEAAEQARQGQGGQR